MPRTMDMPPVASATRPSMLDITSATSACAPATSAANCANHAMSMLLVLARYVFTFASAMVMIPQGTVTTRSQHGSKDSRSTQTDVVNKSARRPTWLQNQRVTGMLVLMGFLDLASYAIFNIGFAACGSALASVALAASGQIATAVISVTILHRHLSLKHVASVAIVTVGLALRALDGLQPPLSATSKTAGNRSIAISRQATQSGEVAGNSLHSQALYGVGCVVASGLLYSILGVMYEVLMSTDKKGQVSQAQVTYVITGISLVATCAHQLLYSLPNWKQLVMDPVAASEYNGSSIAASHVLYGLVTALHNYVQVKLIGSHGAMTLGLVNAVRASLVSFASSWLFCSSVAHLCLTCWKAASALVVTAGAALWVAAGKPPSGQQQHKEKQHAF